MTKTKLALLAAAALAWAAPTTAGEWEAEQAILDAETAFSVLESDVNDAWGRYDTAYDGRTAAALWFDLCWDQMNAFERELVSGYLSSAATNLSGAYFHLNVNVQEDMDDAYDHLWATGGPWGAYHYYGIADWSSAEYYALQSLGRTNDGFDALAEEVISRLVQAENDIADAWALMPSMP